MTWRTVVVKSKAKLSYKNDYLVIRNEDIKMIHLSEIYTIVIDSTAVSITSYLIAELLGKKIKLIFCDDFRNPCGEVVPYYGCHDSSKKIHIQATWNDYTKVVWTRIIKEKLLNQIEVLKMLECDEYKLIYTYVDDLQLYDPTNREGHAAKVYFNALFGKDFTREDGSDINASLNYGYTILLSQFNKEIVSCGYVTQLGIKHTNYFNHFNLSSDLMEPFRPIVDKIVYENIGQVFDATMKIKLVDILNSKVMISGKCRYLTQAISIYVNSIFKAIYNQDITLIEFIEYEL